MQRRDYLLLMLIFCAGCSPPPNFQVKRFTLDGIDRPVACRVVIPHELPANAPLVIAYHGVGDTPESMANYSKLDQLAARHDFLLVYPNADGKLWQIPRSEVPNNDTNRDVERFDLLLQEIEQRYHIDPMRVYVVGMSQGATFVHWLIRQRSARIAAAVAHSGAPSSEIEAAQAGTPILLIAGQKDLAHDPMKTATAEYQAAGTSSEFISVPGLGHQWSTAHNETIWSFLSQKHH